MEAWNESLAVELRPQAHNITCTDAAIIVELVDVGMVHEIYC